MSETTYMFGRAEYSFRRRDNVGCVVGDNVLNLCREVKDILLNMKFVCALLTYEKMNELTPTLME